jgi:hypothetical protein
MSRQYQSTENFNRHVNGSKFQLSMQRQRRKAFHPATFICEHPGCKKHCKSARGLKLHHEAVHAIPVALLIHPDQPDLESQHGEAVPSRYSPLASPVAEPEDFPANNDNLNTRTPSPTFSSHRSPDHMPNGLPLPNARRASPPPINNGLNIITHPLLDGE